MGDHLDKTLDPQTIAGHQEAELARETEDLKEALSGKRRKRSRVIRRFVTRGGELVEVDSVERETRG